MKRRFDELGIEIPFPHQTIYFGEDRDGNALAAPVRRLGDAASPAAPPAQAPPTGRRSICALYRIRANSRVNRITKGISD